MRDVLAFSLVTSCALLVLVPFGLLLKDLIRGGLHTIDFQFLTAPLADAGRAGGIGPILVSTVAVLFVSIAVAMPLAVGGAVFLAEFVAESGGTGRVVRGALDTLACVPSIVFGLFGAAFFCEALGLGFSIASGGLTLACMILPFLTRVAETALRDVSEDVRLAAAALGITRTAAIRRVILPQALPGIGIGIVLSVGRAAAETAALIFTSGYVARWPSSLLDPGRTLSVHVYDLALNVPAADARAKGSALVLLVLLLVINGLALGVLARLRRGTPR
jgi:phosphate transport system permease protein